MFKAEPMRRLVIAASKEQFEPVIREMYRHRVFDIEDFVEQDEEGYEGIKIGKPLEGVSETSGELIKLRSVISTFGINSEDFEAVPQSAKALYSRVESDLPAIEHEVEGLTGIRSGLETRLKEYEQKINIIEPFVALPLDLSLYSGYEHFTVFVGHIAEDIEIPFPCEKYFSDAVEGNLLVVVVGNSQSEDTERLLMDASFQSVPVPVEEGQPTGRLAYYRGEIEKVNVEIAETETRIASLKEKYATFLVACNELLTADVERAEAPLRFATTDETFVAEGWLPTDKVENLKEDLIRVTGGKIFVTEVEVDEVNDDVPVEYDNPDFAHPSELLMDIYARPKYNEFDPTILVSIVFPLFFGLILGDVGYGLILLLMSMGLRKYAKGDTASRLFDTLRNASISSIIFGFLNSEIIGFSLGYEPLLFSRHLSIGSNAGGAGPAAVEMLIISGWIGILHVTLGRGLHIRNILAQQSSGMHRSRAVFGQAGWLFVMWGILMMIWSMFPIQFMPDFTAMSVVAAGLNGAGVFGALMILLGVVGIGQENVLDLIEIPTIISHVLSYTRLVAVGLSSVAIAMVTNYISLELIIEPALENISIIGIFVVLAGIIVFLLGHTLNTALGLLGGGLHSIRLHYVEFFTKFYQGGGRKYNPFGMIKKFTEE